MEQYCTLDKMTKQSQDLDSGGWLPSLGLLGLPQQQAESASPCEIANPTASWRVSPDGDACRVGNKNPLRSSNLFSLCCLLKRAVLDSGPSSSGSRECRLRARPEVGTGRKVVRPTILLPLFLSLQTPLSDARPDLAHQLQIKLHIIKRGQAQSQWFLGFE